MKQVSSRENVLKINFALQYDLCKRHHLAATPDFWKILPKIGQFFGTKIKIFQFSELSQGIPGGWQGKGGR